MTSSLASMIAATALLACDPPPGPVQEGMTWIPGGTFQMGSTGKHAWPDEGPVHAVQVSGFWIDTNEVTNDQFAEFVEATGYVTVAEREIDWEELKKQLPPGTPKPPEEVLQPGSLVFVQSENVVNLRDLSQWWEWTPGASWRHPEGPGSSLAGRGSHPVVQVAWEDADAYARWSEKRLPTEAEWELAARGGLEGATFIWGEQPVGEGEPRANVWQGQFPVENTKVDGFPGTAEVGSFPPNGYGLHDMAGNVWEWCSDWYRADTYKQAGDQLQLDPQGPKRSLDPHEPLVPKRVVRGGSFLCHESYCLRYRPSARIGTAVDSGMSHLGFRCVRDGQVVQPTPAEQESPSSAGTS